MRSETMAAPQFRPQRDYTQTAPVQPRVQPQQPQKQAPKPSHRPRRRKWTKGEKILTVMMIIVVVATSLVSLNLQSSISQTTIKNVEVDREIKTLQKENEVLENKIAKKSTYEHFLQKAKELGLTPNSDNVKAVTKE